MIRVTLAGRVRPAAGEGSREFRSTVSPGGGACRPLAAADQPRVSVRLYVRE